VQGGGMEGGEFGLEDADFEAFVAAYHSASGSDTSDCGTSDGEFLQRGSHHHGL